MGYKKKVVRVAVCVRCGHNWVPRKKGRPTKCAGCFSPLWDRARIYKVKPKPKKKPKKKP